MSYLSNYRVNYCAYNIIVKLCNCVACDQCVSLYIALIKAKQFANHEKIRSPTKLNDVSGRPTRGFYYPGVAPVSKRTS